MNTYVEMNFSFLFNLFVRVSTTRSDEQTGMEDVADDDVPHNHISTFMPYSRKPLLKSKFFSKSCDFFLTFAGGWGINKEAPLIKTSCF